MNSYQIIFVFKFSKDRKIKEFLKLMNSGNFNFSEIEKKENSRSYN